MKPLNRWHALAYFVPVGRAGACGWGRR